MCLKRLVRGSACLVASFVILALVVVVTLDLSDRIGKSLVERGWARWQVGTAATGAFGAGFIALEATPL